jgi:hypothetical protein
MSLFSERGIKLPAKVLARLYVFSLTVCCERIKCKKEIAHPAHIACGSHRKTRRRIFICICKWYNIQNKQYKKVCPELEMKSPCRFSPSSTQPLTRPQETVSMDGISHKINPNPNKNISFWLLGGCIESKTEQKIYSMWLPSLSNTDRHRRR